MTGTHLLDAAIGVIFIVLSFSLIASALSEALATALNWRGRMLRRGLFRLLEGTAAAELVDRPFPGAARIGKAGLTLALLADPAIRVLHGPRGLMMVLWDRLSNRRRGPDARAAAALGRLPSAIPPQRFARALVDTLARRVDLSAVQTDAAADSPADINALTGQLEAEAARILQDRSGPLAQLTLAPDLKQRLQDGVGRLAAVRETRARLAGRGSVQAEIGGEVTKLIEGAETRLHGVLEDLGAWFDATMERVSGWYARRARLALFGLGVMLAASVNTDLAALGGGILRDDTVRAALVERAREQVAAHPPSSHPSSRPSSHPPLPRPRPPAGSQPGKETEIDAVAERIDAARRSVTALPALVGPGFGWSCAAGESWPACAWRTVRVSAVISWLLIGLGCMMGGRFWYDFLGAVLRFRPAGGAAPVKRPEHG